MQVIVSINDEGDVSTKVRREPETIKSTTTAAQTKVESESMDAGAGPFAVSESAETLEDSPFDAPSGLDGGAGPTS